MKRFPNDQLETKVFNMKNFETADTDTDMTFYDFGVIQTEIESGSRHGGYV